MKLKHPWQIIQFIALIGFFILQPAYLRASSEPILTVNIDSAKFRSIVTAIPDIQGDTKNYLGKELRRHLGFSGLFRIMPPSLFGGLVSTAFYEFSKSSNISKFNFNGWRQFNAEFVVIGSLSGSSGRQTLHIQAIDLMRSRSLLSKTYKESKVGSLKLAVRHFADKILTDVTGKKGLFNSKIVFSAKRTKASNKHIYIADYDGSNAQQISSGKNIHISPSFSKDGSKVIYTRFDRGRPTLYSYDLTTRRTKQVSSQFKTNSGGNFSPNGKIVAFTAAAKGSSDLFTVRTRGGKAHKLLVGKGDDVDPAFSPDGRYLAYVSGRFHNPHIFRAELDWTTGLPLIKNEKRLTFAGWYNTGPSWTPASDKIAFAGYDKDIDRYDIFMMNPDGKDLERLTLRAGDNEDPAWSPNGQLIGFHSNRIGSANVKGSYQLYVMNRDGSNQRKLRVGFYELKQMDWGPNQSYPTTLF